MTEFSNNWATQAACKEDPDQMFVSGAEQHMAKRICRLCTVRYECLAAALDSRTEFGVWGGMTERQRRALLKDNPDVPSWRELFERYVSRQETTAATGATALRRVGVPRVEPA